MTTMDLPVTFRLMIDARLDSIERALMANGTGRADRQQILAAIEDQILEMLSQIDGDEPTREDMLRTLAQLDPPEAYLDASEGEVNGLQSRTSSPRRLESTLDQQPASANKLNILAVVAFALTCLALIGSVSWWLLSFAGLIPLAMVTMAAGVCGTIAMYQFTLNRSTSAVCGWRSPRAPVRRRRRSSHG